MLSHATKFNKNEKIMNAFTMQDQNLLHAFLRL